MTDTDNTKMKLVSADMVAERLEQLRDLFPEAFAEDKVDFNRLKTALGEAVDDGRERYGLTWAGKAEAIRNIQMPSTGTLVPVPKESVNFDDTENMIIEGDNLEVLKLLQKSYHGKVKMIYIDPPYNTGNEFIYPDNYREGLQDYLKYSGQIDGEGVKLTTNRETGGRFHSKWLSMMYPRLFLARNLLQEDGLIFVSIDDNEVHNLRALMNEIFGEENFVAEIIWKNVYGGGAKSKHVVPQHEYVLCFCKMRFSLGTIELPPDPEARKRYTGKDEKYAERGPYFTQPLATTSMDFRPNLRFPIHWKGEEIWPEKQWQWAEKRVVDALKNNELVIRNDKGKWSVRYKQYLRDKEGRERGSKLFSVLVKPWSQEGTAEIVELFGDGKIFPFPKPSKLIRHLLNCYWVEGEALILDFFAGSCTTAQAVIEMNNELPGKRKFIMVQLPELIPADSPAYKAGFKTIADIGKERVRRVIKNTTEKNDSTLLKYSSPQGDLGFKSFKLTSSNFKIWDADDTPHDAEGLAKQLTLYADHVLPDRSQQDILYELILKTGLPLTAKIEKKTVAGKTVYSIEEGQLLICLEDRIDMETLRGITTLAPQQVICLDHAFHGNDQLKTNTVLEMRSHDIKFRTV